VADIVVAVGTAVVDMVVAAGSTVVVVALVVVAIAVVDIPDLAVVALFIPLLHIQLNRERPRSCASITILLKP